MKFADDGSLAALDLVPIELQFARERAYKGLPVCADGATSKLILERLIEISQGYGTTFTLENGTISVAIEGRD